MKPLFAILILFFIPKFHDTTYLSVDVGQPTLTVVFDTSNNPTGIIEVSLYKKENFLKKNKAYAKKRVRVTNDKTIISFINLDPNEYSIVSYHDINSNNKLDRRRLLRTPKEPVAVSNLHKKKYRKPRFSESKINFSEDKTIKMTWITY